MPTYTGLIEMVPFVVKVDADTRAEAKEKINDMLTKGFEELTFEISSNLYCDDLERDE